MLKSTQYKNSYFISIEGTEGAGKSTQITFIKNHFESIGFNVVICREPGGTSFGENLRSAILESKTPLAPISEAYLFASSRAQLLKEVILPNLKIEKTIVIADRYIDSSFVYQGIAKGLGVELIETIHYPSPLNELPNLTLYLQIDLQTSLLRQAKRGNEKDYFEKEDNSFQEKLIQGFDTVSKRYPQRIKIIDANNDVDNVSQQIKKHLEGLINNAS